VSLVLEIEFLAGVCRAAHSPANTAPDWPPQPDRVFSALVAAWGARGEQKIEREALEWLEAQPAPAIHAGGHTARTAPDVFVPPNDYRASNTAKPYLRVMPMTRPRQPRRFPVACLEDPVMAMVWEPDSEPKVLTALDRLARDVSYIGHSASMVRCRFLSCSSPAPKHAAASARRRVYPGRLQELIRAYRTNPTRPIILSGAPVLPELPAAPPSPDAGWLVLEAIGGVVPDIRAAAMVARTLRRTLMSGYRRIGMADEIPAFVSGHEPDGTLLRASHLGIVPMVFAGFPHADGRLFGFALVPTAQTGLREVPGLRAAFEAIAPYDRGVERRVIELKYVAQRKPLLLSPAGAVSKRSLESGPYLQPARVWASLTPILLDRHLKRHDEAKIRELIARSCTNVGLPRPDPACIQVGKHSAVVGAPPAWTRRDAPPWTRWRVPEPLATRSLTHAVIDFGTAVAGPVMLGAGRFSGLGLCRRLGEAGE
jgi:CRISPR-associated protein Csb2